MQRVTITVEDEFLAELDRIVGIRGYQNRSEAIRDLTRVGIRQAAEEADEGGACVAALVYTYEHGTRELSKRLANVFHEHHDLSLASLHVHLDHDDCMEVAVLRGRMTEVSALADHVMTERGVRHGRLVKIPVELRRQAHAHGAVERPHVHTHVRRA